MPETLRRLLPVLCIAGALGACSSGQTEDGFVDNHPLTDMRATVWVDPDGCKHWVIDDGAEGYMSPVLNLDGTPDCG